MYSALKASMGDTSGLVMSALYGVAVVESLVPGLDLLDLKERDASDFAVPGRDVGFDLRIGLSGLMGLKGIMGVMAEL